MAHIIVKTRACYFDIFCRLANETISRFPSCCTCLQECLECSCQGRNVPLDLECSDMCGSNGPASGSSGVRKIVMNTAGLFSTSHCYLVTLAAISAGPGVVFLCIDHSNAMLFVDYVRRPSTLGSVQRHAGRKEN